MIKGITLENFKCFDKPRSFTFSKINILTGINGRGKSTVLQSLLLLSQSIRKNGSPNTLIINGEWVKLGGFEDLKNTDLTKECFKLDVELDIGEKDNHFLKFEFSKNKENDRIADLTGLIVNSHNYFDELSAGPGQDILQEPTSEYKSVKKPKKALLSTEADKSINSFKNFHYISADRLGPNGIAEKWNDTNESLKIGTRGEDTMNVLKFHGKKELNKKVQCDNQDLPNTLLAQTIGWLSFVMEGANLKINEIGKSGLLSMSLGADNNEKHLFIPSNIGFGYSYVLPLIVTGLIAEKGDIVIVENPEAHLHPAAQSRLIQFFSAVASSGVQLFIETHSEHIVNAVRLIALQPDKAITNENVSIYFFDNDFNAKRLELDVNSQIDYWPEGFFDQQERDLSQILKLGLLK